MIDHKMKRLLQHYPKNQDFEIKTHKPRSNAGSFGGSVAS